MADYVFYGFFVASKVGKTGLTVTADVFNAAGTQVVADGAASAVGGGLYRYTHTSATASDYLAVFKTADTTVDAQHVPALVNERLNNGFGDVLAAVAAVAASVWAYATRTLTQSGAQVVAAVSGSRLSLTNRVTFTATLTGLTIPATWSKVYLTAKRGLRDADSAAILQIVASNPAAPASDGVTVYAAGAPTVAQRTMASLTVDHSGGTVAIVIGDDLDFAAYSGTHSYDVKCLLADGTSQLLAGSAAFAISLTETATV
jgi:hypothetical protein